MRPKASGFQYWLAALVLLMLAGAVMAATAGPRTERVVVAGGGLTDIIYALNAGDHIVGVDTTSTWPAAVQDKPKVGYVRALAAEGILSLAPTLVLATDEAGPAGALDLVRAAGVPVQQLPAPRSAEDVKSIIATLAALFDREPEGAALIDDMNRSLQEAQSQVDESAARPRVLFVLSADAQMLAAGHDTAADTMLRLAGATNVVDYKGYKPLTPEAAVRFAPEVILTVDFVVENSGGADALLAQPALALTPAGQQQRLVVMAPEKLLGLGSRLGATVLELAQLLRSPPEQP